MNDYTEPDLQSSASVSLPRPVPISNRTKLAVLFLSVVFNAGGQLLFKQARIATPDASLIELFLEIYIWMGLALYGLSSVSWLWVLSRVQLSFAYPVLALSFPLVVGLSAVLFGEMVTPTQWAGVGLVIVGVSFMSRT